MSKKSLKKQDGHSNDKDSEEENEEDLHNAIMEMVRTPDIDESPGTSRRHSEWQDPPEGGKRSKMSTRKVIPIEQAEQGSQTGENREKAKSSRPEHAKLESDDSWATLLIKRFTRAKDTKTVNVPPKSNIIKRDEANPTTNISLKDGTENIKSSTESSNESLVRTEHYGFSKSKTGKTKSSQNQISDGESGEESAEFLEKLRKIEEASKPKSWRRPKPIVIQPKQVSSTTKMKADEVEAKPHPDNEEKHKYINILKVPFHRNLIYAAENETINQPTFNQTPEDLDTRTSDPQIRPQKTEEMNAETPEKNSAEKTFENSEQKKHANSDSQRTLTITGHSHITTKWQDHCHFKDSQHTGVDKPARRKLIVACILCFIFMIVEIVGGVVSNSLAIATDAAHLLTDLASFLISLFALYLAGRPSSERLNFGWYRAEVIGAMISVFFIWVITGEWHPCVYGHYAVGKPRIRSGGQNYADHLGFGHII
ncbi:uncharacterized protein LOC108138258 isoform X2 [Drosophila elegans]|uniref:uncharacterized protein LOC108138258 isoform X2 n=1 Tax=Drosophila elegans TaxID=30023 RepID=UPI0007E80363|nr:uncharacterized protein LOC108138258 isoform X2 [Drosophila elegans]